METSPFHASQSGGGEWDSDILIPIDVCSLSPGVLNPQINYLDELVINNNLNQFDLKKIFSIII